MLEIREIEYGEMPPPEKTTFPIIGNSIFIVHSFKKYNKTEMNILLNKFLWQKRITRPAKNRIYEVIVEESEF